MMRLCGVCPPETQYRWQKKTAARGILQEMG